MTSRNCPKCGREWLPLTSDTAGALTCPTCRQGMAPLSSSVGGRTREEAERAPREPDPPRDLA